MARATVTFDQGLVTDTIGVEGALLQAQDIWIDRKGELRKRGGKGDLGALPTNMTDVFVAGFLPTVAPFTANRFLIVGLVSGQNHAYAGDLSGGTITWTSLGVEAGWENGTGLTIGTPSSITAWDNELIVVVGNGNGFRWSGSKKAAYSTGTVAMTSGDATVTGTGTTWTTNVEAGMYLHVGDDDVGQSGAFRILSVTDNTHLELEFAPTFSNTISGANYYALSLGLLFGEAGEPVVGD